MADNHPDADISAKSDEELNTGRAVPAHSESPEEKAFRILTGRSLAESEAAKKSGEGDSKDTADPINSEVPLVWTKAMQEADWYRNTAIFLMIVAGLFAFAAFITEFKSYSDLGYKLREDELFYPGFKTVLIECCFSELTLSLLFLFGTVGVFYLFVENPLDLSKPRLLRRSFLVVALLMLLPTLLGEYRRVVSMALFVGISLFFRWFSDRLMNERPRDWKSLLIERRKHNWGAETFAKKLLTGKASDGNPLAFIRPAYGEHGTIVEGFWAERRATPDALEYSGHPGVSESHYRLGLGGVPSLFPLEVSPVVAKRLKLTVDGEKSESGGDNGTVFVAEGVLLVHREIANRVEKMFKKQ